MTFSCGFPVEGSPTRSIKPPSCSAQRVRSLNQRPSRGRRSTAAAGDGVAIACTTRVHCGSRHRLWNWTGRYGDSLVPDISPVTRPGSSTANPLRSKDRRFSGPDLAQRPVCWRPARMLRTQPRQLSRYESQQSGRTRSEPTQDGQLFGPPIPPRRYTGQVKIMWARTHRNGRQRFQRQRSARNVDAVPMSWAVHQRRTFRTFRPGCVRLGTPNLSQTPTMSPAHRVFRTPDLVAASSLQQ